MADPILGPSRGELASAAAVYVTLEDSLRIVAMGTKSNAILQISGRLLPLLGAAPRPLVYTLGIPSSVPPKIADYPLEEGWLQTLVAEIPSGYINDGAYYVRVELVRGRGAGAIAHAVLIQGYVTGNQKLAYPGSPIAPAGPGGGTPYVAGTGDPAVGAELSYAGTTGLSAYLHTLRFPFTTDATAGNREVLIEWVDNGIVCGVFSSGITQAASLTRNYTVAPGGRTGVSADGSEIQIEIPPIVLMDTTALVRTRTINRQAGDDYGAGFALVTHSLGGL